MQHYTVYCPLADTVMKMVNKQKAKAKWMEGCFDSEVFEPEGAAHAFESHEAATAMGKCECPLTAI